MDLDASGPDDATAVVVLLHPHPDFGGDRFHPLVDRLHRALPDRGVASVRFDLTSSDPTAAHDQLVAAMDDASARWRGVPVLLVGYSFGAGVAASVDDPRVAGWFLVAPQVGPLAGSSIGSDPRPTVVLVPEHDQFAPPDRVATATAGWTATTTHVLPGDHYLGASLAGIVDACLEWVDDVSGHR